jgi:hypothetical protein
MNNDTNSITISPNNFKLVNGDFLSTSDLSDKIYENGGSFRDEFQYMTFKCGELTVDVNYEISASGSIFEDSGDYWTPPSCDVDIDDIDVTISSVYIDETEVELADNLVKIFKTLVDKNL